MIYITGDKHGEWQGVMDFCDEHETTEDDVMIVLGDAGINYLQDWRDCQLKWALSGLPITILCIHGNHEERPENIRSYREKEWNGGQVFYEEDFPNLLFAKDGEIYDLNGKSALTIGGAYSVDKWFRLSCGYKWFPDEQPDEHTKMLVETKLDSVDWKVDYVFSHTAPCKYEPVEFFLDSIDQSTVDKSTEEWLDKIEDKLDYEKWYLGHYHCEKEVDRIRIMFHEIEEL